MAVESQAKQVISKQTWRGWIITRATFVREIVRLLCLTAKKYLDLKNQGETGYDTAPIVAFPI